MATRTIGIIGALWIVFAPIAAFFLMWEFSFRTLEDYYLGNMLISMVVFVPPIVMAVLYFYSMRKSRD